MPSPEPAPPASEASVVATLRAAGCVFAEDEARLLVEQARTPHELAGLVRRRVDGEPLEQVLGWAEFAGLRIGVEPGVFVPRRRTELLVDEAVAAVRALAAEAKGTVVVVDLCCGSGAVTAAVAARLEGAGRDGAALHAAEFHAADLDPVAVGCARGNLSGVAQVHEGDLFEALPTRLRGVVGVLSASPPYVPTDAVRLLPPEARDHEAPLALDGGPDGLDVVRRVAAGARTWLRPGGVVLVDLSEQQASAAAALLAAQGLRPHVRSSQELGASVVLGRRTI